MKALLALLLLTACAPVGGPSGGPVSASDLRAGIDGGVVVHKPIIFSDSTVLIYRYNHKEKAMDFICTGSLISRDVVLAAAHCAAQGKNENKKPTRNITFFIRGTLRDDYHNPSPKKLEALGAKRVEARDVEMNPQYAGTTDGVPFTDRPMNDLALFHLRNGAPSGVRPATLLTGDLAVGQKVVIAGYGPRSRATDMDLAILRIRGTHISNLAFSDTQQVETYNTKNAGVTGGDSGGPGFLQSPTTGHWLLWGVTSSSSPGDFDVHEVIQKDLAWIVQQVNSWGADGNFKFESL